MVRLAYELTPAHYGLYQKAYARREARRRGRWLLAFLGGVMAGLPIAVALALAERWRWASSGELYFLLAGVLLGAVATAVLTWFRLRRQVVSMVGENDAMTGRFSLEATEQAGILTVGRHMRTEAAWSSFIDITDTPELVVLWIDRGVGLLVAGNAFADEAARRDFVAFVEARIAAAASTPRGKS